MVFDIGYSLDRLLACLPACQLLLVGSVTVYILHKMYRSGQDSAFCSLVKDSHGDCTVFAVCGDGVLIGKDYLFYGSSFLIGHDALQLYHSVCVLTVGFKTE